MLGVGLKLSEPLSLAPPIKAYISSNYSKNDLKTLETTINGIDELRKNVMTCLMRTETDHLASIEVLTEYYETLHHLTERFPWGDYKSSIFSRAVPTIKAEFVWCDTFLQNKRIRSFDVNLEKASILFNLAALYSRQATKAKRETEGDPLKEACRLFKISAGLFDQITTLDQPHTVPFCVDISHDSVRLLSGLMLAQAQACFFEKATSQKISAALVAKLAAGTAALFKQVADLGDKAELKRALVKAPYPWAQHSMYQHLCFSSAAHYWTSKYAISEEKYGLEIAHLAVALKLVEEAKKYQASLLSNLLENRAQLVAVLQARHTQASKDNETIFFDRVPAAGEIEAKQNVEREKFVLGTRGSSRLEAFNNLVPARVYEAMATFNSKLTQTVEKLTRQNQEQHDEAKVRLASMNLPAALEAMSTESGLPEELWTKIKDAQYKGGSSALDGLYASIEAADREAQTAVTKIKDIIQAETKEDVEMRQKYGHKWNRRPSEQITTQFKTEVDQILGYLRTAGESNRKIAGEWKDNKKSMEQIFQTREEIEAKLPRSAVSGEKNESAEKLTELLDELSRLLTKKGKMVEMLKKKSTTIDIKAALLTAKEKSDEQVFSEQLAPLSHAEEALNKSQEECLAILEKVATENETFVSTRKTNTTAIERERIIQELNVALNLFDKLLANMNEGVNFYSSLTKQKIEPLHQRVEDFVFARDMEKRMILDQLTKALAGYSDEEKGAKTGSAFNPNLMLDPPYAYAMDTSPTTSSSSSSSTSSSTGSPASSSTSSSTLAPTSTSYPHASSPSPSSGFPPTSGGYGAPIPFAAPYSAPYSAPTPTPTPYATPYATPYRPPGATATPFAPMPVAAPAPTTSAPEWSCGSCTFKNAMSSTKCAMCNGPKPEMAKKSWW